nr:DUF6020 family protein [uncultured Butyrivibrio sp.]
MKQKMLGKVNKKIISCCVEIILLLLVAFFSCFCYFAYTYGQFDIGGNYSFYALSIIYILVFLFVKEIHKKISVCCEKSSIISGTYFDFNAKNILLWTGLFVLCMLPYIIFLYPGVIPPDTISELIDFYNGDAPLPVIWVNGTVPIEYFLNNHHPFFDSFLYGGAIYLGYILGDANIGIFIYVLLQTIATGAVFSITLCSFKKLEISDVYLYGGIYVLPFVPLYIVQMGKDSTFSTCFAAWMIVYAYIVIDGFTTKRMAFLAVVSLLCSLTKKTGVYVVVISILVLAVYYFFIKSYNQLAIILSFSIALIVLYFCLIPKVLFPIMNIYEGGRQEALGPMIQQVSRVVIEHEDEISESDKKVIENIIAYEQINEKYNYHLTDGVKDTFNFYATDKDVSDFRKTWLKLGIKYPLTYLKATFGTSGGFFFPKGNLYVYGADSRIDSMFFWWDGVAYSIPELSGIHQVEALDEIRAVVWNAYHFIANIPGLNILFDLSIYAWFIPLYAFVSFVKRKDIINLIVLVPIMLSVLVLVICPESDTRYALPIIYCIPLVLGLCNRKREHTTMA